MGSVSAILFLLADEYSKCMALWRYGAMAVLTWKITLLGLPSHFSA
ncbi:hypothetical protein MNBD_GAMMA22-3023 [hydrothermal vent metagenome]|uniref:Uncharacterized protein n=1 Tax=hydrothermal vent metagenome TaxID=652676 RepID=A0A3B0ZYG5_9ZZZZ